MISAVTSNPVRMEEAVTQIRRDTKAETKAAKKLRLRKQTLKDLGLRGQGPKGGACPGTSANYPRVRG